MTGDGTPLIYIKHSIKELQQYCLNIDKDIQKVILSILPTPKFKA